MSETMLESSEQPARGRIELRELLAVVLGYAVAAFFLRDLAPGGAWGFVRPAALGTTFAWLGLALSGPLVLLHGRRATVRSQAESAWLAIGIYALLFGLGGLVLHSGRAAILTAVVFGTGPLLFRVCDATVPARRTEPKRVWTHYAALGLLYSWPLAWGALIGFVLTES